MSKQNQLRHLDEKPSKTVKTDKNCLFCLHFSKCKDPKKNFNYICGEFKKPADKSVSKSVLPVEKKIKPVKSKLVIASNKFPANYVDYAKIAKDFNDSANMSPLPPDLKIDDRDFKQAKNFFEFTTSPDYLNIKPFAKQLEIGLQTFAEVCVAEGTFIHTGNGLVKIEDIADYRKGLKPCKIKVSTKNGNYFTSHAGMTYEKADCLKIIAAGHDITVTPEHQVMIIDSNTGLLDWKKSKHIKVGDYLATPIGMNLWPNKSPKVNNLPMSNELARFIGYLLTDGSFTTRINKEGRKYYYFAFCNTDKKLAIDFINIVKKLFNLEVKLDSRIPKNGTKLVYEPRFCNKELGEWFTKAGFEPNNCYKKEVPNFILQSSKDHVIEFLRAVFDCDGYIYKNRVGITLANSKIIDTISLLLQNLGIFGSKRKWTVDSNKNNTISIKRNINSIKNNRADWQAFNGQARKFCKIIGSNNKQRFKNLDYNLKSNAKTILLKKCKNISPGNTVGISKILHSIKVDYKYYKNSHKSNFHKDFGKFNQTDCVNLNTFPINKIKYYSNIYYNELNKLKKANYAYRKVEKIIYAGKHKVYDLTVPKAESFLANGIVVHNCMNKKCTDLDYLADIPKKATPDEILERITCLEYGVCPRCGLRKSEMFVKGLCKVPHTAYNLIGQRGGKSALAAMIHAYLIHGNLKLQNAPKVYNLLDNEVLEDTLVALTATKAKDLMYSKIEGYLTQTKWFKNYHAMLDDYSAKYSEELYRIRDMFASYRCRSLLIKASDPDLRKLRGATRFGSCFTGDTLINTLRGIVPINQVTINDNVWVNNEIYPVKNVWDNGKKNIINIKFARGQGELNVTKHHVIPTLNLNNYKLVEKRVSELKYGDYVLMQMGGKWPTQPYVIPDFKEKVPYYEAQILINRAWKLKKFTFLDFKDFIPNKNKFYIHTSALRRAGIIKTVFKKQLIKAGEPRSFYKIIKSKQQAEQLLIPQKLTDKRAHIWPSVMTNELARIIGYMVSEGKVYQDKYEFTFPNTNIELIKDFVRCYTTVFGVAPRVNGPYVNKNNSTYWEIRIAYGIVKKFFQHLGFKEGTWSANKEIPTCILESTKEHVCEFLCAMIDGDGCINAEITYTSVSSKLLYQLQAVFRKLKIHTIIKNPKIGTERNNLGQLLGNKAGYIKVVGVYNKVKMLSYLKNSFKHKNYTGSSIIKSRGNIIKHFALPGFYVHDKRLHGGDTNEYIWMIKKYVKFTTYKKHYAINMLKNINPKKAKAAKKWLYKDYLFIKIESITNTHKKEQVYDLEIGRLHHYTANNIYVHNSIDELSWFISGSNSNIKFNAKEILASINNSFETIRESYYGLLKQGMDGLLQPLFFNISSPSSKKDETVKGLESAKNDDEIIGFTYATWEFNPKLSRKRFRSRMNRDPIATMRDFGAVPPNSSAPFISDIEHIKGCVEKDLHNKVKFIPQKIVTQSGKNMGAGKVMFPAPKDNIKRIMCLDPGSNNNQFAIVCGYYDETHQISVFDTFVAIPASEDYPINYNAVFNDIICPMIERLNVQMLVSDRFQSLKFLHDIEAAYSIKSEIYSVKYGDFTAAKDDLLNDAIMIPRPEIKTIDQINEVGEKDYPNGFRNSPIAHFLYQIVTVQDLKKEVIKGEGLTDDLFRAFILGYSYLNDPEYRGLFTGIMQDIKPVIYSPGTYVSRGSYIRTGFQHNAISQSNSQVMATLISRNNNTARKTY